MGEHDWIEELPVAVTVSDAEGRIAAMNARSRATFAAEGGGALVGTDLLACHPEPARSRLEAMYAAPVPNHYTVRRGGVRKMIHQLPWYRDGRFAGYVELSIPVPDELPHFDRD
jgi:hypothetical protein